MSFLTPLYILGVAAVAAPIIFHLIRALAQRRGSVQLAHVPVADPAASDAAQPAGQLALAPACGRPRSRCWRLRLPGPSCARRPSWISATSTSGGSPC